MSCKQEQSIILVGEQARTVLKRDCIQGNRLEDGPPQLVHQRSARSWPCIGLEKRESSGRPEPQPGCGVGAGEDSSPTG